LHPVHTSLSVSQTGAVGVVQVELSMQATHLSVVRLHAGVASVPTHWVFDVHCTHLFFVVSQTGVLPVQATVSANVH
jgi:hypothetical protein